jgi:uncharacterized membrane protein
MHITVLYQAPVYLMRVLTGSTTTPISVSATAYQQPLGGIAISTGLVDGNLGQVNALLQSASGSATLQLSQAERDALDRTPVPLFRIFDGLAASQGSTARAIADVDAASATLKTLAQSAVDALTKSGASSSDAQTSIAALTRLAQQSQSSTAVPVSDIIAMAAHQARAAQDLVSTASDAVSVPALPVLSAYSQAAGNGELVDLAPSLPGGIASIEIALARPSALGQTDRSAIAIGPEGTNASTAIGLIKVTISIAGLGIVPIIIELDAGNATITDVSCGADLMTSTAMTVNAQNGVVKAYIGLLNSLSDLTGPLPSVPLGLVQVSAASGNVGIGQVTQTFSFTRSDISAGTPKSVGTASALSTALNGLVTNLTVQPNIPIVTAAVKTTLTTALNAIEPVLNGLLTSLGVRLGYMDVRATTVRCGIPALVD